MRALLDEQLSGEIAALLRSRDLEVEAVNERSDLAGRTDEQIIEAADSEGRAVVTNNIKDLRPIAARRLAQGRGHPGLILLPAKRTRSRAATGALADGIEAITNANPDGVRDSERWVPPLTGP